MTDNFQERSFVGLIDAPKFSDDARAAGAGLVVIAGDFSFFRIENLQFDFGEVAGDDVVNLLHHAADVVESQIHDMRGNAGEPEFALGIIFIVGLESPAVQIDAAARAILNVSNLREAKPVHHRLALQAGDDGL